MSTLVYAPGIRVYIATSRSGLVDVSDDITNATLMLNENAPHVFNCTLMNPRRKYDGVFTPNDRIIVQLKRIRWLQNFTGYLGNVPMYSVFPKSIPLTAECTLKRLRFTRYDPGTTAFISLWTALAGKADQTDSGLRDRAVKVLTEVGHWPEQMIHIGKLPEKWLSNINAVYQAVNEKISIPAGLLGTGAVVGGTATTSITTSAEGAISMGDMAKLALQAGFRGEAAVTACALAMAESSLKPDNINHIPADGRLGDPMGLFQIRPDSAELGTGKTRDALKLFDPSFNTNSAFVISGGGVNWGPWEAYTNGNYSKYLGDARAAIMAAGTPTIGGSSPAPGTPVDITGGRSGAEQRAASANGRVNPDGSYPLPVPPVAPRTADYSWGGFSNGRIPVDRLTAIGGVDSAGHLLLLHPYAAKSYAAMSAAAERDGVTAGVSSAYRDYDYQNSPAIQERGATPAKAGESKHGWGFALDIDTVGPHAPFHEWVKAHGSFYGWVWLGSAADPYHFNFWSGIYAPDNDTLTGRLPGSNSGTNAGGTGSGMGADGRLIEAYNWYSSGDPLSNTLSGPRALMNDIPVMPLVSEVFNTSMRSFCSAPNGDFIGWFPDYFGVYDIAAKLTLESIEMTDFTIMWGDENLITHQFVSGSYPGIGYGAPNSGAETQYRMLQSKGIASVEFPELMQALFNIDPSNPLSAAWADPKTILDRFGPRINNRTMRNIAGDGAEFFWAVYLFQQAWARQFSTTIPMTFMPEIFPGMLIQIPSQKLQVYVTSVTHQINLSSDGMGFETQCTVIAPSAMDGSGFYGLPRAGGAIAVAPNPNGQVPGGDE